MVEGIFAWKDGITATKKETPKGHLFFNDLWILY